MAVITGTSGNDSLVGTAGNDTLIGLAGADTLQGLAGDDSLSGGDGIDFLEGGPGDDLLDGGGSFDLADYRNSAGAVVVNLATGVATGDGSDTLVGIEGAIGSPFGDRMTGDAGNNQFQGLEGVDTIDGGAGVDQLSYTLASAGVSVNLATGTVTGPHGADVFTNIEGAIGSAFGDLLVGDAGDNFFRGGGGGDTIDGGAGFDTATYTFTPGSGFTVDLAAGTATGGGATDTLVSIEAVDGSDFSDTLQGDDGANRLRGLAGGDYLEGRGGNDTIDGGGNIDGETFDIASYVGATGPVTAAMDTPAGSGTATGAGVGTDVLIDIEGLYGSAFDDRLTGNGEGNMFRGGAGNDTMDGAAGFDYVTYANSPAGVVVNLGAGTASDGFGGTDTLVSIEAVLGSTHADTIVGGDGADYIRGSGGDDSLDGGAGNDIVDYRFATAGVFASLAEGRSSGGDGNDVLAGFETVYGSEFDDVIEGGAGANLVRGRGGNDVLRGGEGADTLRGDAGNDTLEGGNNALWFDIDLADYQFVGNGITVNLATGVADAGSDGIDTLVGMEGAFGGAGNDLLVGDGGYLNFFRGGLGDDTIQGGDGIDIVDYQFGNPTGGVTVNLAAGTATGGAGNDQLSGIEAVRGTAFADLLIGGDGDDTLRGNAGDDTLRGGGGRDSADYGGASGGVSVDLQAGTSSGPDGSDVLESIEGVIGSAHADLLLGDAGDNYFRGGLGNDTIDGRAGTDTVSYTIARGAVTVSLAAGTATGADGNDTLTGIEDVLGGLFDDLLVGDAGANWLRGDDSAYGGAGDDTLSGGGGNDTLEGAGGTDTAAWSGAAAGHRLGFADGTWTVTDLSGAEGADTVLEVERLQFADRTVIVDSAAHGGYGDLPEDLWHFFIVAFDAAPGVTYMDQLAEASRYGMSVKDIVDVFTTKPQFTEVYPATLDEQALAEAMVENIVKDSADAAAKLQAVSDIVEAFGIGWTVGDVVYRVFGNLATKPLDDPQWGGTARQFLNQVEVAKYYTEVMSQSTTDLPTLRSAIDAVTPESDITTSEALVALIGQGLLEG